MQVKTDEKLQDPVSDETARRNLSNSAACRNDKLSYIGAHQFHTL